MPLKYQLILPVIPEFLRKVEEKPFKQENYQFTLTYTL